jgi:hypothetical protein
MVEHGVRHDACTADCDTDSDADLHAFAHTDSDPDLYAGSLHRDADSDTDSDTDLHCGSAADRHPDRIDPPCGSERSGRGGGLFQPDQSVVGGQFRQRVRLQNRTRPQHERAVHRDLGDGPQPRDLLECGAADRNQVRLSRSRLQLSRNLRLFEPVERHDLQGGHRTDSHSDPSSSDGDAEPDPDAVGFHADSHADADAYADSAGCHAYGHADPNAHADGSRSDVDSHADPDPDADAYADSAGCHAYGHADADPHADGSWSDVDSHADPDPDADAYADSAGCHAYGHADPNPHADGSRSDVDSHADPDPDADPHADVVGSAGGAEQSCRGGDVGQLDQHLLDGQLEQRNGVQSRARLRLDGAVDADRHHGGERLGGHRSSPVHDLLLPRAGIQRGGGFALLQRGLGHDTGECAGPSDELDRPIDLLEPDRSGVGRRVGQ